MEGISLTSREPKIASYDQRQARAEVVSRRNWGCVFSCLLRFWSLLSLLPRPQVSLDLLNESMLSTGAVIPQEVEVTSLKTV